MRILCGTMHLCLVHIAYTGRDRPPLDSAILPQQKNMILSDYVLILECLFDNAADEGAKDFLDHLIAKDDRLSYSGQGSDYERYAWIQEAYEKFAILQAAHIKYIDNLKQLLGEVFDIKTLQDVIRHEFQNILSKRLLLLKLIESRANNVGFLNIIRPSLGRNFRRHLEEAFMKRICSVAGKISRKDLNGLIKLKDDFIGRDDDGVSKNQSENENLTIMQKFYRGVIDMDKSVIELKKGGKKVAVPLLVHPVIKAVLKDTASQYFSGVRVEDDICVFLKGMFSDLRIVPSVDSSEIDFTDREKGLLDQLLDEEYKCDAACLERCLIWQNNIIVKPMHTLRDSELATITRTRVSASKLSAFADEVWEALRQKFS